MIIDQTPKINKNLNTFFRFLPDMEIFYPWQPDSIILPVYLMSTWTNNWIPAVGALSVVIIVIITILTITARILGQRRSYVQEM